MYVLYDDQRQDEEAYGYRKTDPEHDRRRKESRFAIERISAAFFIDKKFRLGVFFAAKRRRRTTLFSRRAFPTPYR